MKLTVLQENLAKSLAVSSRFVSFRTQLPVLANILFSAGKNKLRVAATNLETSAVIGLGAQVKEEGELTVPAKIITEIIANLPAGPLELESDQEHLKIKTPHFTAKALGMNSADFPKLPQVIETTGALVLPKKELLVALNQVLFAVSADESRPILTGVLFAFSKEGLSLVATDGFRLSQKKIGLKDKSMARKVVLPKNPLVEIVRLGEETDEIKMSCKDKESQAVFGLGEVILSSRVLEGEFPDYEKIIPKSSNLKIRTDKEELLRAVKLASVFARDSANIVKFKIEKESLTLSAESPQAGNQEASVEAKVEPAFAEASAGKGFEISFNYRFLEEFLRAVSGEEVCLEFTDAASPGVFTDPKDPDFLHLIMPVKIQE